MRRHAMVLAAALGLASARPHAQTPTDSALVDSVLRRDSVPPPSTTNMMEGALQMLVVAPAALIVVFDDSARWPHERLVARDYVALYVTGGRSAGGREHTVGGHWAGSGTLEVMRRGYYGELRLQQVRMPERLRYRTARMGGMASSRSGTASAGMTIGYRDVTGPRPHGGVEVAFPLVVSGAPGWLRLESAYVMSRKQSSWNYRVQGAWRVRGSPCHVGGGLDLTAWELRRHGQLSNGALSLLVGATFPRG